MKIQGFISVWIVINWIELKSKQNASTMMPIYWINFEKIISAIAKVFGIYWQNLLILRDQQQHQKYNNNKNNIRSNNNRHNRPLHYQFHAFIFYSRLTKWKINAFSRPHWCREKRENWAKETDAKKKNICVRTWWVSTHFTWNRLNQVNEKRFFFIFNLHNSLFFPLYIKRLFTEFPINLWILQNEDDFSVCEFIGGKKSKKKLWHPVNPFWIHWL